LGNFTLNSLSFFKNNNKARSVQILRIQSISVAGLQVVVEKFPNLVDLHIQTLKGHQAEFISQSLEQKDFAPFFALPKLKHLRVFSSEGNLFFAPFERLETLNLHLSFLTAGLTFDRHVMDSLALGSSLTALDISFTIDLRQLVNLTELSVTLHNSHDVNFLEAARCPQLEVLKISFQDDVEHVSRFPDLNYFKTLKKLTCSKFKDIPMEKTTDLNLRMLKLWSYRSGQIYSFQHMDNMEELVIYASFLGTMFSEDECIAVSNFRKLRYLSLFGQYSFEGLTKIIDNVPLSSFCLDQFGGNDVLSYESVRLLLQKLDPERMEALSLLQTRVDLAAMQIIAQFTNLQNLSISVDQGNEIYDEWLLPIANLKKLDTVDIHVHAFFDVDVDEEGELQRQKSERSTLSERILIEVFQNMKELEYLNISNVTKDLDQKELERELNHIEVISLTNLADAGPTEDS
jgi:hypothetical protein